MSISRSIVRPLQKSVTRSVVQGAVTDPLQELIQQLFGNGEQGVFGVIHTQYLWQDAAKTVPVVSDGDPVRVVEDLSGNGNDLIAPTDEARPSYREGVGLEFDGVSSAMMFSSLPVKGMSFALEATDTPLCPVVSNASSVPEAVTTGNNIFLSSSATYSVSVDGASGNTGGIAIDGGAVEPVGLDGTNIPYLNNKPFPRNIQKVLTVEHSTQENYETVGYIFAGGNDTYGSFILRGIVLTSNSILNNKTAVESFLTNL